MGLRLSGMDAQIYIHIDLFIGGMAWQRLQFMLSGILSLPTLLLFR
jgi:hypothetical protein